MELFNVENLKVDNNLILKTISKLDEDFIENLFEDSEIKRFYIIPKEAGDNHKLLVDYWLNDIENRRGCAWIIIQKGSSFFSSNKKCGFIAFEFRGTTQNARISYALHPKYRGKGLITESLKYIINILKKNDVHSFEADIDVKNVKSERVVEKLGFTVNKKEALIDPHEFKKNKPRIRALWKMDTKQKEMRDLVRFREHFSLNTDINNLISEIKRIVNLINNFGDHYELLLKYYYLSGRIEFHDRNFEKATDAFASCNRITANNRMKDIYETYYWFARIREETGESKSNIIMYYDFALEKYYESAEFIPKDIILQEKARVLNSL